MQTFMEETCSGGKWASGQVGRGHILTLLKKKFWEDVEAGYCLTGKEFRPH